jgi:hypothetical protein
MLKRSTSLLLLSLLIVPACGRSDASAPEMDRNETVPVRLEITMKGDVNLAFRKTVKSYFVARRIKNKETGEMASAIVGTQPVEPVKDGGSAFLAGVAIIPFAGNGKYTIPVGSPLETMEKAKAAGIQPESTSSIQIDWWPTGAIETAAPETYNRRAKPCSVVIEKLGARGIVECPDVTDESRQKHFSFSFRWLAPIRAAPTTTSTAPSVSAPEG